MVRALPALTDAQTPSVVAVSIALAMLVSWPNSAAQADGEPTFDEEIVVTGSRIRRDPLDARDSVLNVDADDRDRSGITSLGNMLARLSVSGSPLTTRFNSSGNFGFPADGGGVAAGASQVDLLAFAAGIERRLQSGSFDPDPVVSAGDTAGQPAQPTADGFRVTEWYGEMEAPLVSGASGADLIDISAAIRYFHYSTFDGGTTGKIGLRWRPIPNVLLRGTWTEGFRAPNIGELFGGLTRLDAVISDSCASFLTTNVGQTVIDGSYTQLGAQVSVLTGGNELLEPETSESVTLSLAWRPGWALDLDWIDDLRFELTRYDHEVDNAITGYDAQAMLDGCYRDRVDVFCRLIQRNNRGGIAGFRNTLFNVGAIQTNGWDFCITLGAPSGWRLQWHGTYLAEYSELLKDTEGTVIETRSLAGQTQADRGKPAWKSTLAADWTRASWNASWTVRYIHGMAEPCSDFLDGTPDSLTNLGLCSMPDQQDNTASRNHLASTTYHDAQATYTLPRPNADVVLALGVNNLLDRDPPASQSASINGHDASVYDITGGRFVYFACLTLPTG